MIRTLTSGHRVGDTPGLRQCDAEGWFILAGNERLVRHAPRHRCDPKPWTDGFFRYNARECWAEQPPTPDTPAE